MPIVQQKERNIFNFLAEPHPQLSNLKLELSRWKQFQKKRKRKTFLEGVLSGLSKPATINELMRKLILRNVGRGILVILI